MDLEEIERQLRAFYRRLSSTFTLAQKRAGMPCPAGCGRCCQNTDVSASPLEMLPMALALHREGQAETTLERLTQAPERSCIAFQAGTLPGQGQCTRYEDRPVVCRAFAVSAIRDKDGVSQASLCGHLKRLYPSETLRVSEKAGEYPLLSDEIMGLTHILPEVYLPLPLNEALSLALKKVLFYQSLGMHEE